MSTVGLRNGYGLCTMVGMSNLFDMINTVNVVLKDPKGFDRAEVDKTMVEIHAKLTEPKWAIEDEKLRDEVEKLVVSWAANRYLADNRT